MPVEGLTSVLGWQAGSIRLKLAWPEEGAEIIWRQTSNPVDDLACDAATGFVLESGARYAGDATSQTCHGTLVLGISHR